MTDLSLYGPAYNYYKVQGNTSWTTLHKLNHKEFSSTTTVTKRREEGEEGGGEGEGGKEKEGKEEKEEKSTL